MDNAKLAEAMRLEAEAQRLRYEAFAERPLPDHWRVGDRIRYIRDMEYCCDAGSLGVVVKISAKCAGKSAREYQVFWTRPDSWATTLGGTAQFWTTPGDVELVENVGTHKPHVGTHENDAAISTCCGNGGGPRRTAIGL